MLIKRFILIYITAGLFILTGCGFYSHTGASVPPNAKTFSVEYLNNVASIVMPSLSQVLTEKLKLRFINETTLKLTQQDGDIRFSGKILNYVTSPVAVQGNQQNAVNRLTVTIEITYQNTKDDTKNFTQQFSNFVDYPASENFSAVEIDLVNKVTDILVQDVFNKAFINW
jgi:outer membrane lipopolysaccharide assembly protein LptE/RlpB